MKKPLQCISLWFWGILLAVIFLAACQKSDPEMDTSFQQSNPDIKFISSLGYDVSGIEKVDDGYLVEGDIWLTDQWLADAKKQPQTRLTSCQGGNLVGEQYRNKLFLNISSICSGSNMFFWDKPLTDALNEWNKIDREKCYIKISNTQTGNLAEIKITFEDKSKFSNNLNKLMKVTPPSSDGTPGSVMINKECKLFPKVEPTSDGTTMNHAKYLVMHAIGHALGLGHTLPMVPGDINNKEDWGENITTAPALDSKSIMQKEKDPLPWTGFSSIDKDAIPQAFPIPALAPGTINAKKVLGRDDNVLNIYSEKEASTAIGTITYQWEQNLGGTWRGIPGQTGKDLLGAFLPKVLQSQYRRGVISGDKSDYSNTCYVEYEPLDPGSITKELLIYKGNTSDIQTIASTGDPWCPLSSVTYTWEVMEDNTWTEVPDITTKSLTIKTPQRYSTMYRRKALCSHKEHGTKQYSEPCSVYNESYVVVGTITELVEINKTGFDRYFNIFSKQAATPAIYQWEINTNGSWASYSGFGESLIRQFPQDRHITKFRRKVITPFSNGYSKECTVINHAYREDPTEGAYFDNRIKLGTYGENFTKTVAIDTRGKYFRDDDRLNGCGNDAFFEFEITRKMYVDIVTGSYPMNVWLDVRNDATFESLYSDISSGPLVELWFDAEYIPFPVVQEEPPYPEEWIHSIYLLPGKYFIQLQGSKVYNSGCVNEFISINLRGTTRSPEL